MSRHVDRHDQLGPRHDHQHRSQTAAVGLAGHVAYCASKFGLVGIANGYTVR
jgi:hypothetical protein